MIKFKLISLVLGILVIDSCSQTPMIKSETNTSKYFVDTVEYNQIDLIHANSSDEYHVLWLDSNNYDYINTEQRVKQFFYTTKGDFSLSQLFNETLSDELPIELYLSFYKIIPPNDQFSISILIRKNNDHLDKIIKNLKRQVVIINVNDSKRIPPIKDLERYSYKPRFLILSEGMIKNNKN